MAAEIQSVSEAVRDYLGARYWKEEPLLAELRKDIEQSTTPIQVPPETAKLLQVLVMASGAKRIVEVGTLFGYSAICMAQAMAPGGHIDTIEFSAFHADKAEQWIARAGFKDVIKVNRGKSRDVLPMLTGPYDMAFLDGEKTEYVNDAELAFDLLRPGGILLADNLIRKGAIVDPDAKDAQIEGIRRFHEYLASKSGVVASVLPVGDGVGFAVKA
jgi:predicted O-methyltransferase YrrM